MTPSAATADTRIARGDVEAAAAALLTRAERLLEPGGTGLRADATVDASAVLRLVAAQARSMLRRPDIIADAERARALFALAADAAELDDARHLDTIARRNEAGRRIEQSLGRLRHCASSGELLDAVCREAVVACGLRRVMLSRFQDGIWDVWRAHFSEDRELESEITDWIEAAAIRIDAMALERRVLDTRRAALVFDASGDERAHGPIAEASGSSSYVVAPIVPAGRVVGLLHADHHPGDRRVDETDRDALWTFAEGFGRVYERTILLERLRAQREHVRATFQAAEAMMSSVSDAEIELVDRDELRVGGLGGAGGIGTPPATDRRRAIDALLTPREREVLAMLVRGLPNRVIAEALLITQGTVKSHVKHILRKVGAANRTEVISRYLAGTDRRSD